MIVLDQIKQNLDELIKPLFVESAVDLIELNVRRQGNDLVIQLIADRPTGGISLEECAYLNHKVVERIDESGVLTQEYSLELSSPGLDRALTTHKDFMRVLHQEIRFLLTGPVGSKQEYTGILKELTDDTVIVQTSKYGEITIPLSHILKAYQVF